MKKPYLTNFERVYMQLYYQHHPNMKRPFFIDQYELAKAKKELRKSVVQVWPTIRMWLLLFIAIAFFLACLFGCSSTPSKSEKYFLVEMYSDGKLTLLVVDSLQMHSKTSIDVYVAGTKVRLYGDSFLINTKNRNGRGNSLTKNP